MWRSNPTLKQDCLQLVDEPGVRVHKSSPNTVDGLHRELIIVLGGTKRIVERWQASAQAEEIQQAHRC